MFEADEKHNLEIEAFADRQRESSGRFGNGEVAEGI